MNRFTIPAFCSLAATIGGLYGWTRLRSEVGGTESPVPEVFDATTKHVVTGRMAEASRAIERRAAPPFEADGSDGRRRSLAGFAHRGPLVLTFVKVGCPCSEAAQPFLNRLHAALPVVPILGVIDVDSEKAQAWAGRFRVEYPLLLDQSNRIVRDYQVENSAYVVVIDAEGRILKHWPGYSAGMLRDLAAMLAGATGIPTPPVDVADAPDDLYTGCPYEL